MSAWAARFFGEHLPVFAPATLVGLLGLKHEVTRRSAIASAPFCASMFEKWMWAKHGRLSPVQVQTFRDRLRHFAIRDGRIAAAESELAQGGFLLAAGLGEG